MLSAFIRLQDYFLCIIPLRFTPSARAHPNLGHGSIILFPVLPCFRPCYDYLAVVGLSGCPAAVGCAARFNSLLFAMQPRG